MRHNFSLLLFMCITCTAFAKDDSITSKKVFRNTITVSGTNYYIPFDFQGLGLMMWLNNRIGIDYKRKISKKTYIQIGYSKWNNMPWYRYRDKYVDEFAVRPAHDGLRPGTIDIIGRYKIIDLAVSHQIYVHKRHSFNAGLSISYTWGKNNVIDSITIFPGKQDALFFAHEETAHYYGIVPFAGYDYQCFGSRMNFGADIRYRHYLGYMFNTWEYGFHIGFLF
jgi:hypothetical protein